jgi:starvation-inducible outer membrane lipoprotein
VYEVIGPESGGKVLKTVAEILKTKAKTVSFPKGTAAKPDPKYKDKLVVTKYLGRQIYVTKAGDSNDIKYGDVLESTGKIKIIAINNTIDLMNASGQTTTVIGPLTFTVEQVLTNKNLYKFLNVQK